MSKIKITDFNPKTICAGFLDSIADLPRRPPRFGCCNMYKDACYSDEEVESVMVLVSGGMPFKDALVDVTGDAP